MRVRKIGRRGHRRAHTQGDRFRAEGRCKKHMHWSKTRHADHDECPRRFFYTYVAAPQNPAIRKLADEPAPALIRHEAVRRAISKLLKHTGPHDSGTITAAQEHARVLLRKGCPTAADAEGQITITDACIENFGSVFLPSLSGGKILHLGADAPAEFIYDKLSIMVQPEIAIRWDEHVEVATWKTGSPGWHNSDEARLKSLGLTLWVRSALKIVDVPVHCTDVYLRAGAERETTILTDDDLAELLRGAKDKAKAYSRSARVKDFEAKPGGACRFCRYTSICPAYGDYYEIDYSVEALAEVEAIFGKDKGKEDSAASEKRDFFICHVSADKESVVRPLARAIQAEGMSVWLDEAEILVGDSIIRAVQKGLRMARFVICCVSDSFFDRGFPNAELSAALQSEIDKGETVVVPVVNCALNRFKEELPLMADKRVAEWKDGPARIVKELKRLRVRG